jgi:hypothetical protein
LNYLLEHVTPPSRPQFRLPPSLSSSPSSAATWNGTPGDWFLGTWYFFASSSPVYQTTDNMQWTLTSISQSNDSAASTHLQDLTTYYINGSEYPFYGFDSPIVTNAYTYIPTGLIANYNNTWTVIAWGYDSMGVPYSVLYETAAYQSVPYLDFISRDECGIQDDTFQLLQDGVRHLNNIELNSLLANVTKLTQSGARNGQPYPSCNATCMTNGEFSRFISF